MLTCMIIDSNPESVVTLKKNIAEVSFLNVTNTCYSTIEASGILAEHDVDLLFLTIEMPELNGIDFVKSLKVRPMIIFITEHAEYAVEAFRMEALDFLQKPIKKEDFTRAVNRARETYELHWKSAKADATISSDDEYIFVKSEYKIVRIRVDDITYVESMSEYVRIHLDSDPKPVLTLMTLRKMEDTLPPNKFMRVHRSYIVNLAKVTEVSRMRIVFGRNVYLPVGDLYKDKFMAFIEHYYVGKDKP